ncbi:hypothetical protein V1264_015642 [Littorina saxatilis]|uniref:LisH domain-containing protein n=1 Tax=Littorina saxatilis TaxID=31220 RepID=A0AAN9BM83_9CAEN
MQIDTPGQYFLPSEICRVVLGFLKEGNYMKTYMSFLKECVHLREYQSLLKSGREYPTTILGLSLVELLDEYGSLKLQARGRPVNIPSQIGNVSSMVHQLDSVLSTLKQTIPPQANQQTTKNLSQSSRTRALTSQARGLPSRLKNSRQSHTGAVAGQNFPCARVLFHGGDNGSQASSPISVCTDDSAQEIDVDVDVVSEDVGPSVETDRVSAALPPQTVRTVVPSGSNTSSVFFSPAGSLSVNVTPQVVSAGVSLSSGSIVFVSPGAAPQARLLVSGNLPVSSTVVPNVSSTQQISSNSVIGVSQHQESLHIGQRIGSQACDLDVQRQVFDSQSLGSGAKTSSGSRIIVSSSRTEESECERDLTLPAPRLGSIPGSSQTGRGSDSQLSTVVFGTPLSTCASVASTSQLSSDVSVFVTPSTQPISRKGAEVAPSSSIMLTDDDGSTSSHALEVDLSMPTSGSSHQAGFKRRKYV